jgi:hypothetical protein
VPAEAFLYRLDRQAIEVAELRFGAVDNKDV